MQTNILNDIIEINQEPQKIKNCYAHVLTTKMNDMKDFNDKFENNVFI
jgi:hypothetical protein